MYLQLFPVNGSSCYHHYLLSQRGKCQAVIIVEVAMKDAKTNEQINDMDITQISFFSLSRYVLL